MTCRFNEPTSVHYLKFLKEGMAKIEQGEVAELLPFEEQPFTPD